MFQYLIDTRATGCITQLLKLLREEEILGYGSKLDNLSGG
jgi:hypothetical protein